MSVHTYDEIRAALARRLGHEPKEEIWDRLVNEAYVRDVWLEIAEINYLEEKYREFSRQRVQLILDSGR